MNKILNKEILSQMIFLKKKKNLKKKNKIKKKIKII